MNARETQDVTAMVAQLKAALDAKDPQNAKLVAALKQTRLALLQVKVDCLNTQAHLPITTHALVLHALSDTEGLYP